MVPPSSGITSQLTSDTLALLIMPLNLNSDISFWLCFFFGLRWIIALLCWTLSLYLYFCGIRCFYIYGLFFVTANHLVWPDLFQVTMVKRRSGGSGHHLAMLSRLLDPHTHTHIVICIIYSVSATCKLWFCCYVLYMRHLLHVCPSWERDLSSAAPPDVSSIFFFPPS